MEEIYHQILIDKSNQLYNELLEKEIIPEMERENEEHLSLEEFTQMVQKVEETIFELDKKVEASVDTSERKVLRSERKFPK